jgi:hypothetical protein
MSDDLEKEEKQEEEYKIGYKHPPKSPWVKGVSGNPAGRPKGGVSITEAIKRRLNEIDPKKRKKVVDIFADSLVKNAIKGNGVAMRIVVERVDGVIKAIADEVDDDPNTNNFDAAMSAADKVWDTHEEDEQ